MPIEYALWDSKQDFEQINTRNVEYHVPFPNDFIILKKKYEGDCILIIKNDIVLDCQKNLDDWSSGISLHNYQIKEDDPKEEFTFIKILIFISLLKSVTATIEGLKRFHFL